VYNELESFCRHLLTVAILIFVQTRSLISLVELSVGVLLSTALIIISCWRRERYRAFRDYALNQLKCFYDILLCKVHCKTQTRDKTDPDEYTTDREMEEYDSAKEFEEFATLEELATNL